MLKLVCEGCKKQAEFETADEAFLRGWDCAPMFPFTTCGNCGVDKTAWYRRQIAVKRNAMKASGKWK